MKMINLNKGLKKGAMYLALASALFTLTACSTTDTDNRVMQANPNANVKSPRDLKTLDIQGRLAFISPQNKVVGAFSYNKFYDFENFKILSPIGTTVATLNLSKDKAELITSDMKHVGKSGSELLYNILGINIPVDNLFSIFVADLKNNVQKDKNGFVTGGTLGPYIIKYKTYRKVKNLMIPSSLELSDGRSVLIKINNNKIKI